MNKALIGLVVIVLAGGAVLYVTKSVTNGATRADATGPGAPTYVIVEPVAMRTFIDEIEAIGTTQANESVTLTAKLTDTVRRVNFTDGDFADAGQVLVELTNEEQTALLAEAKANLDDSKRQLDRIEDLVRKNSIPVSQADETRARFAASKARFDAIVARLDDRLIRAPFSGVLGFRRVSQGTLVTPGTAITTLDDVSVIKLDFTVPEVYMSALSLGQHVRAESQALPDKPFEGVVKTIDSRVDPVTRSIVVRAHIENSERALRPGMLLTVRVRRAEVSALAVRESSLQQVADRTFVFVADQGRALQREVQIGRREPGFVEVTGGVTAGEEVVTEGLIKLRDGVAIRTTPQPTSPGTAAGGT